MRAAALPCLAVFAAFAAEPWEDPAVNSLNRLPPRTYSMPLADEAVFRKFKYRPLEAK